MTSSKGSEGSWDPHDEQRSALSIHLLGSPRAGPVLSRLSLQPKDLLGLRSISAHTRMAVRAQLMVLPAGVT